MTSAPYLIGIAGPSGAGKSYLASHLAARLPASVLSLDRYYRDLSHLPAEERAACNFDAPESLQHELLIEQVARLRNNETVDLPAYDFSRHTRAAATDVFRPAPIIVLEGLFTLYWPGLRKLLDTKVYIDTPAELCFARRLQRDVRDRGRTLESVEQQYTTTVAPMAERYVYPTISYADIVVHGDVPVAEAAVAVLEHHRRRLSSKSLVRGLS